MGTLRKTWHLRDEDILYVDCRDREDQLILPVIRELHTLIRAFKGGNAHVSAPTGDLLHDFRRGLLFEMRLYARIRFEERRNINREEVEHRSVIRGNADNAASETGVGRDFVLHPSE